MTDPVPRLTRSSSRQRRSSSRLRRSLSRVWSEWWAEILIALFAAFGIFLIFERMQIRQTLLRWLRSGWAALTKLLGDAEHGLGAFIQRSTLSDLAGLALLAAGLVLVAWRIRWRLLHSARFTDRLCPRCGSTLHRIHRRFLDRVLSLAVPVRRYHCDNRECHWRGLRFGKGHHS
jgi:hypothetical protein